MFVERDDFPFELHTSHIPPGSSNGWIKIDTFEGIFRRLAQQSSMPRILCGDFNSPQQEWPDGRVMVFGERLSLDGAIIAEKHRGHRDGRWAAGERSVLLDLAEHALPDIFRQLTGYEVEEASWFLPQNKSVGRRFDHVFASERLNPSSCRYLHSCRDASLSDHSALEVVFDM